MLFHRSLHASDDELNAYLDGRLADRMRERVSGHLAGCAICLRALDGLRTVRAALQDMARVPAPRSFALREGDVRPAVPATGRARAMPLLSGVTAAAALAFFVLVGFDVRNGGLETSWSSSSSSSSAKAVPRAAVAGTSPASAEQVTATLAGQAAASSANGLATTPGPAFGGDQGALSEVTMAATFDAEKRAAAGPETSVATPAPALTNAAAPSSGNDMGMHMAEAALASIALGAGAGVVIVSRRRSA